MICLQICTQKIDMQWPLVQHGKAHSARQQLDSQLNENKMVKEVMDTLGDADNVFKLVGPALIKQDVSEAKQVRWKYFFVSVQF